MFFSGDSPFCNPHHSVIKVSVNDTDFCCELVTGKKVEYETLQTIALNLKVWVKCQE
jgi:hypothetical protein